MGSSAWRREKNRQRRPEKNPFRKKKFGPSKGESQRPHEEFAAVLYTVVPSKLWSRNAMGGNWSFWKMALEVAPMIIPLIWGFWLFLFIIISPISITALGL